MSEFSKFKAIYCSGLYIPNPATVTALSLLFDKVYLPKNIDFIKEFSKRYRFGDGTNTAEQFFQEMLLGNSDIKGNVRNVSLGTGNDDPLNGLTELQRKTANLYLARGIFFALSNKSLFPDVFETQLVNGPFSTNVEDAVRENEGKKVFTANISFDLDLDDNNEFTEKMSLGYFPIVDNCWGYKSKVEKVDAISAREIAALLAMKSISVAFPNTIGVHPEIILEARHKLSDHLPPFWSAMLKLSVDLKSRIKEAKTFDEVYKEAQFLVDTTVIPALIDLRQKMIREKKDWFYKILSPIQKGLRVFVGNPPLTQQQLISNALVLSSDVLMSCAENMRTINTLKAEAGLTFLLETQSVLNEKNHRPRKR